MKLRKFLALFMCLVLCLSLLTGCGKKETPPADDPGEGNEPVENTDPVPDGPTEEEMTALADISKDGAKAVTADKLNDGTYDIAVSSGSGLFRILESKLVVVGNILQLVLKVEGDAYSRMYAGPASEAASAAGVSQGEKDADGNVTFRLMVKSLNEVLTCSAYADAFGRWFDRTLFADADSLVKDAFKPEETKPSKPDPKPDNPDPDDPDPDDPTPDDPTPDDPTPDDPTPDDPEEPGLADGDYSVKVTLTGGTGRAYVHSPATLHVVDGKMTATIQWSSENYDYMIVKGKKYYPESTAGGSVFTIPVKELGKAFKVIADTTAMSVPHEIEYTIKFELE